MAKLEPFSSAPEIDRERELVTEDIQQKKVKISAVKETPAESFREESNGKETLAGFLRLKEFLKKEGKVERDLEKERKQALMHKACGKYKFLADQEEAQFAIGIYFDKSA